MGESKPDITLLNNFLCNSIILINYITYLSSKHLCSYKHWHAIITRIEAQSVAFSTSDDVHRRQVSQALNRWVRDHSNLLDFGSDSHALDTPCLEYFTDNTSDISISS